MHGRLVEAVSKSLENTALDPGCIEFEIGDGDIVNRRSSELETLHDLRNLGVRLSLDHFGTGDLSFSAGATLCPEIPIHRGKPTLALSQGDIHG